MRACVFPFPLFPSARRHPSLCIHCSPRGAYCKTKKRRGERQRGFKRNVQRPLLLACRGKKKGDIRHVSTVRMPYSVANSGDKVRLMHDEHFLAVALMQSAQMSVLKVVCACKKAHFCEWRHRSLARERRPRGREKSRTRQRTKDTKTSFAWASRPRYPLHESSACATASVTPTSVGAFIRPSPPPHSFLSVGNKRGNVPSAQNATDTERAPASVAISRRLPSVCMRDDMKRSDCQKSVSLGPDRASEWIRSCRKKKKSYESERSNGLSRRRPAVFTAFSAYLVRGHCAE